MAKSPKNIIADTSKPWFTGSFRGEYIGISKNGSIRSTQIFDLKIVRATITGLSTHVEQPIVDSKKRPLLLDSISNIYTHNTDLKFGENPKENDDLWKKYTELFQVQIYDQQFHSKHYNKTDNTVHGFITGTVILNLYPPRHAPPTPKRTAVSSLQTNKGCFGLPISARRLVLASMLTLNNINLDVLSIFNLHFFTVSITDLPSSDVILDTDNDGIIDTRDKCPFEPEDIDGFEDADGCPESDNDLDGIADDYDKCPNIKGAQDDGCPSAYESKGATENIDIDNDGIPNTLDQCPEEAETFNNYNDYDGCPDEIPAELKNLIGIQTAIQFETNTTKLKPDAIPELKEITTLLLEYPTTQIIVEGHTDGKGTAKYNQRLSEQRAETVRSWIIEQGVGKSRILTKGYGFREPIASNASEEGRSQNRRVEINCHQCEIPETKPSPQRTQINPETTAPSANSNVPDTKSSIEIQPKEEP